MEYFLVNIPGFSNRVTTYSKRIRLGGKRPRAGVHTRWGQLSWHDGRDRGGRQIPHFTACLVPTKLPTCRTRTHTHGSGKKEKR